MSFSVIVGLGVTGLSCAQYLNAQGLPVVVMDTRSAPPHLTALKASCPEMPVILGGLDAEILAKASRIILSPGISLKEPLIAAQVKRGVPVIGDIELFAESVKAPVIAITGTNAKSTVTTLVGMMAAKHYQQVQVGGNLGVPALDLLKKPADIYVLELSSFQLETTSSLKPAVAAILNITPDHMDRYETLAAYQAAKYRIYQHCQQAVCNRDDILTAYHEGRPEQKWYFTLNKPSRQEFGLITQHEETFLAYEDQLLMPVKELALAGKHNYANALAALAIAHGHGLPVAPLLQVLREFKGLPHRCQFIRHYQGVGWYNDSKGTNVGATLAAIAGLGGEMPGKLVLILGGIGKQADFHALLPSLLQYSRHAVLMGEAAPDLAKVIGSQLPVSYAASMEEAVHQAAKAAKANDNVLLSPACASFDMFKNY